jgi:glycogen debranching enzyme
MTPLKSNHCYAILDAQGMVGNEGGVSGVFLFDTRHVSRLSWNFGGFSLLYHHACSDSVVQYWSRTERHEQKLLIRRRFNLRPNGADDILEVENPTAEAQGWTPGAVVEADFADIFRLRGETGLVQRGRRENFQQGHLQRFRYLAPDGVESVTETERTELLPGAELVIAPKSRQVVELRLRFKSSLLVEGRDELKPQLPISHRPARTSPAIDRALADLEALLLTSAQGPVIAAGMPNFVTPFGRDSLITSWLLLDVMPDLARNTLCYLAARIGAKHDPFHDEEPGRILHEVRLNEFSRLNQLPFCRYYGAADSNSLFLRLLGDYCARYGTDLALHLEDAWRAAVAWIESKMAADGYLAFQRDEGAGLTIKSWKDSGDSMSYADGRLATTDIVGVEIQAYAYAALRSAARLSAFCCGEASERGSWCEAAAQLARRFNRDFWMEGQGTYALALDGAGRQLDVSASNAGLLLWTGIVPKARQARLAARLFEPDMWSGWGVRTLGSQEVRYNPLSYHNGSVWPHDNAIIAAGLLACGHIEEFLQIRNAMHELALSQPDLRLPELFGGYPRSADPPLPYLESCRPQAWAAAAILFLEHAAEGIAAGVEAFHHHGLEEEPGHV